MTSSYPAEVHATVLTKRDVERWAEERCVLHCAEETSSQDLYDDYVAWTSSTGWFVASRRAFGDALTEMPGLTKRKTMGVIVYRGIGLACMPTPRVPKNSAPQEKNANGTQELRTDQSSTS